jgi:carbonic anhydrase/acetyltransferase-like protein (isoleucine patch superfamily)
VPVFKEFRGLYPKVGHNVYLADDVVLIGDVTIEDDCSIWWGSVLRGDCGALVIGHGSNVQDGSLIHATTAYSTVRIGPNVSVGHHAIVHGASVEEGVLVGMKSTLLDLAHIGAFSIVGAGAVVLEGMEVPADRLVTGIPAKIKQELLPENRAARLRHAEEYRELAAEYLGQEAGRAAPEDSR